VVVYASLAGTVMTVLGLYIGLRQLWHARRGNRYSPYRGFLWWHHLPALAFGVFTFTWVLSGLASMQPWGWLEGGGGDARARLRGASPSWATVAPSLTQVLAAIPQDAAQLSLAPFDGRIAWLVTRTDGTRARLDEAGRPAPFLPSDAVRAATLLDASPPERLTREDSFHYSGPDGRLARLPAWRAIATDGSLTRFYFDAVTGGLLSVHDPDTRAFRWWHLGLHRLDFMAPLRTQPLRDIVLWLTLAGTTFVCATGAWLGLFRLIGRPWRGMRPPLAEPQSRGARSD
jgi:hypothetical protein